MHLGPRLPPSLFCAATAVLLCTAACGQDGTTASGGTTATSSSSSGAGGTGGSGGAGPTGEKLTIFDWNVHNLYDNHKDVDETVVSKADYDAHVHAVGVIVRELDPDIAVFAEVENTGVLDDLNTSELEGAYTPTLIDGNDLRLLDVGVLSKLPFTKVVSHKDDEFTLKGEPAPTYKYSRDCIEVHLDFGGREIVLLGVHFRSKGQPEANPPIPDAPDKRLAEAQHTRDIAEALTAENPDRAIVILGDFNDTPGSNPYKAIQGSGPTAYVDAPDAIPASDRWTYNYNGTKELIDHQMMNNVLAPMLDGAATTIRHGEDVNDASDHSPIFATYRVH